MIDLVEDLANYKKVYILYDSITTSDITFAVYSVTKVERRGTMKYYAQLKTSSQHKWFKKTLNVVGLSIEFPHTANPYKLFDNLDDLRKHYCKQLKKEPEKNPKLLKKLTKQFPEYFI
jgi:hypothetical protein